MDLIAAHSLIWRTMVSHGLFESGWAFEWDNAKRRFGMCSYRTRTISMSKQLTLLNTEAEVLDTILHEVAHALIGPGHKHNYLWQSKARLVGARPIACYASEEVVQPTPKFIGRCVDCGKEVKRFRMTRRVTSEAYHVQCRRNGKEAKIEWRKI